MTNYASATGILLLLTAAMACRRQPAEARSVPRSSSLHASDPTEAHVPADSLRFPFIRFHNNQLQSAERLDPFFEKLSDLHSGTRRRVRILHVGDSHIQAGFFTGILRKRLQERFGNAGRGLVVPYVLAGSHNTLDLGSSSSASWDGRLRTFQKGAPPIGLSGTALRTRARDFKLQLWLRDSTLSGHDGVQLFAHPGENARNWKIRTPAGELLSSSEKRLAFGVAHRFELPAQQTEYLLESSWQGQGQEEALLFGVVLESLQTPGVLYHAAGLNGATFYHFNRSGYFFEQIPALEPDLVIVSLGANESLLRPFHAEALRAEIRSFLTRLQQALPGTPVLVSSQPDALTNQTHDNAQGPVYSAMLREEAAAQQCAFWDLFGIMGGKGAIRKWKQEGLAYKDMVHYTQAGYQVMAELLFTALMEAYGRAD